MHSSVLGNKRACAFMLASLCVASIKVQYICMANIFALNYAPVFQPTKNRFRQYLLLNSEIKLSKTLYKFKFVDIESQTKC